MLQWIWPTGRRLSTAGLWNNQSPTHNFSNIDIDSLIEHLIKWKWVKIAQLCSTLCGPMDYTVHGILQARIPEWVAIAFSRRSSQPRDGTQVSHIAGGFFISWATKEAFNMCPVNKQCRWSTCPQGTRGEKTLKINQINEKNKEHARVIKTGQQRNLL